MKAALSVLLLAFACAPATARPPGWLAEALSRLKTEIPAGAGYTVEISRNADRSVERFDPARPPAARWTLLSRAGRAPTAEELVAYARQRGAGTVQESSFRAAFRAEQLDLSSARVVEEDDGQARVTVQFSSAAIDADKMLGRLELTLFVRKDPASVREYRLHLPAPYSPVLGVRMLALDAGATFGDDGLPVRSWSHFRGRIFFRAVDEKIEAAYRDYVPAGP